MLEVSEYYGLEERTESERTVGQTMVSVGNDGIGGAVGWPR